MNKLRQLPIGTQVLLIFGTLGAILLIIGGLFFFSLRAIERRNEVQQSRALNELALMDDTAQDVGQMQADVLRQVLASDAGAINSLDQTIHDIEKINAKELADYQQFVDTEKERQLYNRVMQARKAYWEQTQTVLAFGRANRDAEATEVINSKQAPAYDEFLRSVDVLIEHVETNTKDVAGAMARFLSEIRTIGNTLAGIAMVITLGTGFAVLGIGRRLKEDNRLLQAEVVERKRAEETLRESEEKFRQLAENIADVFWMTSTDLRQIHYVSPAYEQIWGRSAQSSYANPHEWAEAIPTEDRERVFGTFLKLAQEPSVSAEFRIARPDGAVRWIFSRGFQVRDTAGNVVRFTGIASDITERKRAEEELRWKTAFLEAQVNSSIDGILVVDPEGKQILQNQRVVDLFKIPRHIADDKDDQTQVRWVMETVKSPEQFGEKVAYLYAHPDEISRDEIELKDGTTLDRYSAPVVGKDGKYYGRIWTFRDITERKQLETRLFQSQKMETVGKLAGGIAHEFNSILTAIIGRSELLLNDLPSGSPDFANAIAIRKAADLAAALTKQLLAYGRKQILRSESLNLNRVLAGMEAMLRHLMGNDVDVRVVTAVGLPAVKVDAGQVEQVIMNIAVNAREAMRHGGKLTLETSVVTLNEEYVRHFPEVKPGDYVMMAISDTGTGMSEEVKARLFEPFFTTKGVGEGTGLGLATCHGIIKQSGGHISVYSELGRGTTFKVYLPQAGERTEVSATRAKPAELPRGTETILLVEDDSSLREMASLLLQRLGYAVLVAANGTDALNLTQQPDTGRIDLLFTDIVMPQMDGKDLSDRVLAMHPKTKVLFTSAYTETAIVHQGGLDPGVSLLQKPFTPAALASKVRELLDARS